MSDSPKGPAATSVQNAWTLLTNIQNTLSESPQRAELRLARLRCFIELGLRTLALHDVQQLIGGQPIPPVLEELITLAKQLPDDVVSLEEREQIIKQNLSHLPNSLQPTEHIWSTWREVFGSITWLRTRDGNIVRCNLEQGRIAHLQDMRGQVAQLLAPLNARLAIQACRPIILEGFDPPWMFEELYNASTGTTLPNFRQRLIVVQEDAAEFLNGLACIKLNEKLADERTLWFIGTNATEKLKAWTSEQLLVGPPQCVISNPQIRQKATPSTQQVFQDASRAWELQRNSLTEKVQQKFNPRSTSYWNERFQRAHNGGEPLRIVLLTSRFSTYILHSAEDLLQELRADGHDAQLLVEPDQHSLATDTFYLDAMNRINPDLVICINFPRSMIPSRVAKDIPYVCWIQDMMPHLLDSKVGEAQTPLDFTVGMVSQSFYQQYAYPREQVQWMPMSASTRKFQPPKTQAPYESDICWITHHGEPAPELHKRLIRDCEATIPDAADRLCNVPDQITELCRDSTSFMLYELHRLKQEIIAELPTRSNSPIKPSALVHSYVDQMAERIFRLETARWAVRAANKNGWTLKLHGRGWDINDEFTAYAAPEIAHGEDLVRCYSSAAVQLHASLTQPLHQRVAECAFSGGLPLCRITRDSFSLLNDNIIRQAEEQGYGRRLQNDPDGREVEINQLSQAQHMVSQLRRLRLCAPNEYQDGKLSWPGFKIKDMKAQDTSIIRAHTEVFNGMLNHFFATESDLESLLAMAISDSQWRNEQSAVAQNQLMKTMSTKSFSHQMLEFVTNRLNELATTESSPTHSS